MATDTEAPFAIRSLIGEAGVGSNGEKLVNALLHLYPAELTAAQERRPNVDLTRDLDFEQVGKIVGDGVDVRDAVVRGGELGSGDAWVTFAGYDSDGDTVKGAFPYKHLGRSSSEELILQTDKLQDSEAARDFRLAQAKADQAAAAASSSASSGDPIADYEDMKAQEVVAYVEANPERAKVIAALESATRPGDERKTVLDAVAKAESGGGTSGSGDGTGGGTPPSGSGDGKGGTQTS